MNELNNLLTNLNQKYVKLHKKYEELFWISYMGDHSQDKEFKEALAERDNFRSDPANLNAVKAALAKANKSEKENLIPWLNYFSKFQTPKEVLKIKEQVDALEAKVMQKNATMKEGYIDPYTKKFVTCSRLKMRQMMRISDDEKIRKACWAAYEKLCLSNVSEYLKLVELKNKYAQTLGFKDFYHYKSLNEEGMDASEIFSIFDKIYQKTKYAFKAVRDLEKNMPGLRKPWNFGYMMAGDFTKEEDQYFQFQDALIRWGKSFAALGIDFKQGRLQLDLLDRVGKYSNGFCHWPEVVHFKDGKRISGASNFTCNVVAGQVGSGSVGMNTLFHEGGHSAHLLNCQTTQACSNSEYPPASTAWAETQSMFIDSMFSSIEWKIRYAKNSNGQSYPFDLFERIVKKMHVLSPLSMMGIGLVIDFERQVYSAKKLNKEKLLKIAKNTLSKHTDYSEDSLSILNVPHIYSWESSCSYHGYGLATLALTQWRQYFYQKYGYIVDNKNVGREMEKVWALGSTKTFREFVRLATGKNLSPEPFIQNVTMSLPQKMKIAQERIKRLSKVKPHSGKIRLNATIKMVHGKQVIADNKKSFEQMADKYAKFLHTEQAKSA